MAGSWAITREVAFSAAHHLPNVPAEHKCRRPHGHNYRVIVKATTDRLTSEGFVIDFGEISDLIRTYDHHDLNEYFANPTAEVLAESICKDLQLGSSYARIESVTVHETDSCEATYVQDLVL